MSTWPPSEDTGAPERPAETPRLARDTTPENPWPLSKLSYGLHGWIERAPAANLMVVERWVFRNTIQSVNTMGSRR